MSKPDGFKQTEGSVKAGADITKALRALCVEARRRGCKNPKLFFESESAAVFVMDGDDPREHGEFKNTGTAQEAIVLRAPIGEPFDTGAW